MKMCSLNIHCIQNTALLKYSFAAIILFDHMYPKNKTDWFHAVYDQLLGC